MATTRAIIFDIDGTLADLTHRLHHISGKRKDYDAFFDAMGDDTLIKPIAHLLANLYAIGHRIVLCSGRPSDYRGATEAWLLKYAVPYAALYMRTAGDHRPDHVVKAELLAQMRTDGYDPWLAIDDRPSIVAMWRANGITCLQCRDWDERPSVAPGILTLMVGPSGAGKSTWLFDDGNRLRAQGPWWTFEITPKDLDIHPSHIVSSDQIRADLCGDFRDQSRNDEVFAALHAVVKTRITHGLPTVVDATNLRRKDRLSIATLTSGPVRYIVIDRPIEEKRRDAGWRAEIVGLDGQPFDLIGKHDQTFRSQLRDIIAGDDLPNVEVIDLRVSK